MADPLTGVVRMDYSLIVTASGLEEAVSSCLKARICGVDTETTGLDPHTSRLRLIQLAVPGRVWVVDAWRFSDLSLLGKLLADRYVLKVFHNAAFDLKFFRSIGLREVERLFDTMLASQLLACGLQTGSHSLEALAEKRLGVRLDKTLRTSGFGGALSRDQVEYAASDAAVLLPLYESLGKDLVKESLVDCAKIEFAAVPAVADMEYAGIKLDLSSWKELGGRIREKRDALRRKLDSVLRLGGRQTFFPGLEPPANPNSPAQVKSALAALGIDVPDTSESTLKGVLGLHPVVGLLLEYREQEKMLTAFIDKLPAYVNPATGRIHPTYDQLRAASGRFACRDPNIQQIPRSKEFRKCFVAPGGKVFVIADFSQVELRIAAALSKDKRMIEAYSRGEDLHKLTASVITGKPPEEVTKSERQAAKACFSGDTEVLTPSGWVRLDRYDGTSPVAQYVLPEGLSFNPPRAKSGRVRWDGHGGTVEFVRPLGFRAFSDRDVYRQKDRNTDLVLTGDHEVVFLDSNRRPRKVPALCVAGGNVRYVIAAGMLDRKPELSEIETRLLAMTAANGSFRGSRIRLGFVKQSKVDRCLALLDQAGLSYRVSRNGRVTTVLVDDSALTDRLLEFVSPKKDLSWRCVEAVNGRVYLEEAAFWDGSFVRKSGKKRVLFSTVRSRTADVMQAMAAVSGIPSVLRVRMPRREGRLPLYVLSYRLGGPPLWRVSWRLEPLPEKQTVYCVQVPSGALLVRRNGRVSVQGNCNFGLIYGMSAQGLKTYARDSYGVEMTEEEAARLRERFFDTYKGIAAWHRKQRNLKEVRTRSGRLRRFPEGRIPPTELYNTPVQGTGADILKCALAKLRPHLIKTGAELVACVHDEVVVECPEEKAEELKEAVEASMRAAGEELVPEVPILAEASVGKTWADKS